MPFDYKLESFKSDSDKLCDEVQNEISKEFDSKIDALESRINQKQRVLHDSILDSVNRALASVSVSLNRKIESGEQTQVFPTAQNQLSVSSEQNHGVQVRVTPSGNQPVPSDQQEQGQWSTVASRGHLKTAANSGKQRERSVSPSVRRLRDNAGRAVDTSNRSNSKPPHKPCVIGTSSQS